MDRIREFSKNILKIKLPACMYFGLCFYTQKIKLLTISLEYSKIFCLFEYDLKFLNQLLGKLRKAGTILKYPVSMHASLSQFLFATLFLVLLVRNLIPFT